LKSKVWQDIITIPTYKIGTPEKYPVFLEKRVYQGSSGAVYPFPVIEKIFDEKEYKEWKAVFLENDFIKIMILPELGGRIQMAYDKMKGRHFIYYNQVIKPALVGLNGPWISGGIEFNWPQHHRPSTFESVDYNFEEYSDGSATIRVSEIERMSRTRGTAAFTLYADRTYLEISVQLYNRTQFPQTFLWWANPAVKVNEHYQSVFPPDVRAVYDHGKRDVSTFPIATGTYYKVDYSTGVDISKYKNIPVPTSFMAVNSKYDFLGGYEHDTKGGILHVANHHVSPGKKQWTWGNGDFGHIWDRNLTDEDGPYVELMCGVYTDNQPDFSWLRPYEEKSFKQYFFPYQEIGIVKNANKDAMLNLEFNNGWAEIKISTTGRFSNCSVLLTAGDKIFLHDKADFKPGVVYQRSVQIDLKKSQSDFKLAILLFDGSLLLSWQPESAKEEEMPKPALPALQPEEIDTTEELYLNGLHLEQYRHAAFSPLPYYEEALRRDPDDVRNNNALGLWFLRRSKYTEAEKHFKCAINRLTSRNPNPYDNEPYFNLGLVFKQQNRLDEAYNIFYKTVWDGWWQDAGYFNLALIDTIRNNYKEALELVERSLMRNRHNHKARHLKCCLLRHLGLNEDAMKF
jgi:tetratricopeptide (TPR) repeat protein